MSDVEQENVQVKMRRSRKRWVIALGIVVLLIVLFWPIPYKDDGRRSVTVSPGRALVIKMYDKISDYVLYHVDLPLDFELPVTVTSYPSSPATAAIIGGRGRGFDCSLPWGAGYVFRPRYGAVPISLRFRQACAFHDLCYRHGLATYGYLQNDCDEMLQEHSFRICRYVFRKEEDIESCRIEAKKITLAVRLFGTDAFQGWSASTFHEFDPFPVRATRFAVSRLLTRDADDPRGAAGLDLVRFETSRAGTKAQCTTCASAGNIRAGAAVGQPREGVFAAPSLVNASDGRSKLAFATRHSSANTAVLLANGHWSSKAQTVAVNTNSDGFPQRPSTSDLLGSTLYPLDVEGDAIAFVTPTVQCDPNGRISLLRQQVGSTASRHCGLLQIDGVDRLDSAYRLFQHQLLIDSKRQRVILFKRDDEEDVPYDQHAGVVIIEFQSETRAPYRTRILRGVKLGEIHEPLSLLPSDAPAPEPELVSLVAPETSFSIVETVLDKDRPEPVRRDIHLDVAQAALPQNWIDRPPLLLRDGSSAKIVLSRLVEPEATKDPPSGLDGIVLQLMSLQRETGPGGSVRWKSQAATRCEVSYQFKNPNAKLACHRKHTVQTQLPTAINRLRGSQTLAGNLRRNGETDIVIVDPCLPVNPIILESGSSNGVPGWTPATDAAHVEGQLTRDIAACRPLGWAEIMSAR